MISDQKMMSASSEAMSENGSYENYLWFVNLFISKTMATALEYRLRPVLSRQTFFHRPDLRERKFDLTIPDVACSFVYFLLNWSHSFAS